MSSNVDLVAVGVLLGGIALYVHTRNFCANAINAQQIGVLRSSHVIVVPAPPPPPIPAPPVRFMRD